jgi:hypothetical protein
MITDKLNYFAEDVDLGASGTRVVGDVIDTQGLGGDIGSLGGLRDLGNGQPIYLQVLVTENIVAASTQSGTVTWQLVSADNTALSSNPIVHAQSGSNAYSDSVTIPAGTVGWQVAFPIEADDTYSRYVGVREVVTGNTASTGTIRAFLTIDPKGYRHYPQADVADETSPF